MINYFNLPIKCQSFIKDFDYVGLSSKKYEHDWAIIQTSIALTIEGEEWFRKKGFKLRERSLLFKIPNNFTGPIHIDTTNNSQAEYGFNFVLKGHGTMQWLDNIQIDKNINSTNVFNETEYTRYKNVKSFDVIDSWDGVCGLVRVNTPHRVVSQDVYRYVISFRTKDNVYPIKYEDAYNLLQE